MVWIERLQACPHVLLLIAQFDFKYMIGPRDIVCERRPPAFSPLLARFEIFKLTIETFKLRLLAFPVHYISLPPVRVGSTRVGSAW